MTMTATGLWMRCSNRKRKTSGCEADICFSCATHEQMFGETEQKVLKARICESKSKAIKHICYHRKGKR